VIRERAPAKVNLLLHVGSRRSDGLHELCSLFASIDLADEVTVEPADADEVHCAGVEAPNLALATVDAQQRIKLVPITIERDTGTTLWIATGLTGDERMLKIAVPSLVDGDPVEIVQEIRPPASGLPEAKEKGSTQAQTQPTQKPAPQKP